MLAPLGMTSSGLDVDVTLPGGSRRGRPRPPLRDPMPAAGALRSSATDLLRWLGACLEPPPGELGRALAVAARPRLRASRRLAFGLGWMVLEPRPRTVWHNGGTYGFRSFGGFVPDRGVAAVVLTNASREVTALGHALVRAASGDR